MSFQIDENEKDRVAQEVNKALSEEYFPVQSQDGRYELDLDDVFVDDSKDPVQDNPGFITEARTEGKSYDLPLKGRFQLYKDGDKVDEHEGKIGPYYPKVDNLGTRIIGGKHYQNKYQVRRSPGIYPFKKNGQPRVEFNSKQGSSFNMVVDNEGDGTPTFDLQFTGQNRKSVDRGAYTMMKMFGVDENEIEDIMGDTYKYNSKNLNVGQSEEDASELDLTNDAKRIYDTIVPDHKKDENDIDKESASFDEIANYTKNFLEENPAFDSVVNQQTIGQDNEFFSPEVVRDSTEKLVQTFNGQHQPAHRFNEKFRTLHSLPTQMRENIIKDPVLRGQFTRKVDNGIDELAKQDPDDPSVTDALGNIKDNLKKKIQRAYTSSDLSTTTETNNILDIDHRSREVTLKGKGGIQSEHAIQPETIELHPSRIGMTDIVNTQKSNPGVTVPIANGATVGEDGDIERRLYDREQGEVRSVNSAEVDSGNVGFPDEFDIEKDDDGNILNMEPKSDEIMAGVGDDVKTTNEEDVRYVVPQMSDVFSDSTNFVPFLNHNSGPRTIMGARQMGQAVSLEDPDTPAVDTVDSEGQSFSKKLGEKFVPKSDVSGTVSRVTKDAIHVEDESGDEKQHPIFNDMPLNRGGYINHEPEVEEGDEVSEGDVLAKNNYTDEEGKLAIGKNLRTAYMPFNGFNYEDAMVMSESGAQKLSSNHMYEKVMEVRENDRMGLDAYDSYLSDRGDELSNEARQKLDSSGMIREGETVEQGDILMAGVGVADMRNEPGKNEQLSQIFENIGLDDEDRSVYWDKPFKGEVTKVKDTPKEKRVYVKSKEPMKEGDKISARDGGKGIVSKIVPDNKMPQTEDGRVPDVLVDPHGVPSRANPGQIFELAAGKLAKKKGEPYEVENFGSRKDWEELKKELDEEDVDVKEDLYDPQTGRKIPDVAMGHKYQAKLVHKLDKKFAARGINEGYDMDRQPTGGASMDNLTVHSMIGHNARANMAEMSNLKGTKNDDYWTDLATNQFTNRKAEVPYSFKKFQGMMESLGVNIERDSDDLLQVMPLTDEEIENQSSGAVQSAQAYETYRKPGSRGRNALDPFDKGLFDPNLIGESGKNRNHIELPEPVPNPTFTKGIQQTIERGLPASLDETPRIHKSDGRDRPVRDVAQKDIEDIYKGDASIEVDGKKYDGGDGLKEVLSMVDTEKTEEVVREKAENYMEGGDFQEQTAGDYKTALRYFTNLNDNDINPEDAFINEKIPVMRAEYRQPLVTSDGEIHNQPVNKLYAATIKGAGALKQAKDNVLPEETIKKRREGLLHDIGALYGGAGYEPRGDFKARSIMDQLAGGGASAGTQYYKSGDDDGKGPKTGYVQKKVMKKQQEPSGRSTIVPSGLKKYETTDALGVDEVGMPEEMAWKTFEPWVRKRLTRELGSAADAADQFENRTTRARQALEEESKRRPVMLNRAPSWWPYNVTAHDPKIIEEDEDKENTEKAIRIPNMVVAPYQGGDFDGDSVSLDTFVTLKIEGEIWQGRLRDLITGIVGDVPEENYRLKFEDVQTLNQDGKWIDVNEITIHHTDKDTYEVETRSGYKVRVTSDHSLMVDGEEVRPENLDVEEDVLDNTWDCPPVDNSLNSIMGLPAGNDAGFIIGMMAGDGGYDSKNGRFYFAVSQDDILDRIKGAVERTGMGHLSVGDYYEGGFEGGMGRTAIVNNASLSKKASDIVSGNSLTKAISGKVLNAGLETIKGVVEGYISADGSVESTRSGSYLVRTWSRSEDLRDGISTLLWALQIPHSKRYRRHNGDDNYIISIGRDGIERMNDISIDLPGQKGEAINEAIYEYEHNRTYAKRTMPSSFRVESVKQVEHEDVVVDMTTEDDHVFCVGPGIIVHNTMSLHVPAEDEAIAEAESLKPSRNLRAPGSKKLMAHPDHSQLMGLHDLSLTSGDHPLAKGEGEAKEFQDVASIDDLVEKYNKDEIPVHQKVKIRDSKGDRDVWTPGWAMIDRSVRAGSNDNFGAEDILDKMQTDHPGTEGSLESTTFDDTTLNDKFMESLMRHHPDEYADVAHQLSMAGAKHATNMGFTTGFDDIKPEDDLAQRYYDGAEEKVEEMAQQVAEENGRDEPNEADRKEAMVNVFMSPKYELNGSEYKGAIQAMEDEIESRPGHNSMTRMMQVGSRGSSGQIRQLLGTVGLPKDVQKDFINEPIKSSLNRGLKGGEYFLEQHGTIKGLRDRAVETSKPGYLGKQIIASSQHQIITEKDCGTENGVEIPLHNDDGQLNMEELNGRVPAGEKEPLSGERLSAMEREGTDSVEVRSPLTCEAERGICQKCYGMTANGNVPEIGDNVGVRSGQSLLEASTKMTLKSFHCLHRNMTVWIRDDNGEVRMPTIEQLWNEQSTKIHEVNGQKERKPDGDLEVWGEDGWIKAQTIMRHPQEENTEMTLTRTQEGAFIISQDNHPHMAKDNKYVCPKCGKALKCKSCETKMDNWYCRDGCVTKVDVSNDEPYNKVEPQEMDDRTHRGKIVDKPEPSDAEPPVENGWLAGMFVAEGSVRHVKEHWKPTDTTNIHPRSVQWSQSKQNEQLRSRLISAIENEHGKVHFAGDDGKSITLDSTETAKLYNDFFNRYSENKGAPDNFAGYDEEWLCGFVAGVLDGDGTIKETKGYKQINLNTTSPLLVQQMLVIGRILNVPVRFRLTTNRALTRNQGYVLTVELVSEASKIIRRTNRFNHLETKEDRYPKSLHPDVIDYVRSVYTESTPTVYDIETEKGTLAVNNMWTHNSTGEVDKTEPSFERFQELVQLKTPQIKASIAKGNPGEKFEVKEVNDIEAQGEQIGTEVKYESKDTGNVTSTQINNQHDIRDKVQPGNEFESGERFTNTGNYDIEELRSARGIKDAQDYLTNQLHNIFGEIGGINRRAAETAVRSMSDFGTIVDPGASDYAPGQKVRVGKIRAFNEEQDSEEDKVNMKPQLHSMNKVPQLGDNWLAKLNFEDLKKHIRSAGIEGQGAEIHGTSPVASYMYGAELDKGDEEWQY